MVLKKLYRPSKKRYEWVLVSRSSSRPLQWFGPKKPSRSAYLSAERRVQFYKHRGSTMRTTIVRSHRRKGRRVRAHKRKIKGVLIPQRERKVFDYLSSNKFKKERSGFMDFNKKGQLEAYAIVPGKAQEAEYGEDWEIGWHTHVPSKSKMIEILGSPSPEDMVVVIKNPKIQAALVFHEGETFSVVETPESKKLEKLSEKQIIKRYSIDDEIEFIKQLKKDGFFIGRSKKGQPIRLPIIPKEPRRLKP